MFPTEEKPERRRQRSSQEAAPLPYTLCVSDSSPNSNPGSPLPDLAPYCARFSVRHPTFGLAEIRYPRACPQDPELQLFAQEMALLAALDHPFFPPVLEIGPLSGSFGYLVPKRLGPSLAALMNTNEAPPALRLRWVQQLGRGLGAAHGKGVVLETLAAHQIFWNPTGQHLRMAFPLAGRTQGEPELGLPPLPNSPPRPPPTQDVARWARLASGLLRPCQAEVPPALAFLVESCLGGDPTLWPANGIELAHILVRIDQERHAIATADLVTSTRHELSMLRTQIGQTVIDPQGLSGKFDLQCLVERVAEEASERLESLGERGRRALLLVLGSGLALALFAYAGAPFLSKGLVGQVTEGGVRPLASGSQQPIDPEFQRVLRTFEVTPRNFLRTWYRLRGLLVARRLPPDTLDFSRLGSIRKGWERDQLVACLQLEEELEALRKRVAPEPEGSI